MFKISTLLSLFILTTYFNISYASCSDDTVVNIIKGTLGGKACPSALSGGELSAAMLALVGDCPSDANSLGQSLCSNQTPALAGTALLQCQAFYKQAYYGKVQAACYYLANVKSANDHYATSQLKP